LDSGVMELAAAGRQGRQRYVSTCS
jgi:hypothetical protein